MGSRNYLLIVLEGENVPDRIDTDCDNGNATNVHTSDLKNAIYNFRAARRDTLHVGQSVRVRAVCLDSFDNEPNADFKVTRAEAPLCIDPIEE